MAKSLEAKRLGTPTTSLPLYSIGQNKLHGQVQIEEVKRNRLLFSMRGATMSHYIQGPQEFAILASNLSYFGRVVGQQGDFLDEGYCSWVLKAK